MASSGGVPQRRCLRGCEESSRRSSRRKLLVVEKDTLKRRYRSRTARLGNSVPKTNATDAETMPEIQRRRERIHTLKRLRVESMMTLDEADRTDSDRLYPRTAKRAHAVVCNDRSYEREGLMMMMIQWCDGGGGRPHMKSDRWGRSLF
jgi:hypothetical protein